MFLHNGLKFDLEKQHVIGSDQFGAGHFHNASERERLGIVEVPDPIYPDPELFTYVENLDGTLTITPRTAEDLVERQAAAVLAAQAQIEADALAAERLELAVRIGKLTEAIDQYQALLDVPYVEPAQAGSNALEIAALRGRMKDAERNARGVWRDLIAVMRSAKYLLRQAKRGF